MAKSNLDESRRYAADIVAAYLRNNQVSGDQIASVIRTVHDALSQLGQETKPVEAEHSPAVPIRRSVTAEYVICLDCGWRGQMLRRHLGSAHGSSIDEYRRRWKLPREHPMTASRYSERRSALAKKLGLGRKAPTMVASGEGAEAS